LTTADTAMLAGKAVLQSRNLFDRRLPTRRLGLCCPHRFGRRGM